MEPALQSRGKGFFGLKLGSKLLHSYNLQILDAKCKGTTSSGTSLDIQVWLQCMQMSQCTPEAAKNFASQVKHVIDSPLTYSGQTLLMLSSSIASLNLVIAFLPHKPNIKIKDNIGRSALHYASAVGNAQIFQILIKCGADPKDLTIGGQSPLSKACLFAQGDIIQWYLNNCLQAFDIKDRMGNKPLEHLKSSGESLYDQVKEVYEQLSSNQMKE